MRLTAMCLVLLSLTCPDSKPESKPHLRIIVFQDITMSMAGDEAAAVQTIVDEIVDKVPVGTELIVIPICENTERAPGRQWTVLPDPGSSPYAKKQGLKKRAEIKEAIASFVRDIRTQTTAARSDYSSCISPGLRVAKNVMHTPNSTRKRSTDVIFVSDMIEECRSSLLGQPVRLKMAGHQFSEAAKLVSGNRPLLAVPPARVFVILPKALSTSMAKADYPRPADLQSFWQQLFARSGITSDRLWWDANVSQYLDSIRG
jgi:hypothetical protein